MTDHTFPLDAPINLHVRVAHGSITVEPEDDLTEARVSLDPGKHGAELLDQTTVELRDRTLAVIGPRQGGVFDLPVFGSRLGRRGLDIHIAIPSGTAVKISTFTAPIRILGRVGGADLAFGSAEAGVRHVDGDLRLRFGSGTARAVEVSGAVQLRSGSGKAVFGEIAGSLNCVCGSGDLSARVVHGAVHARLGSGSAQLACVHGNVDLASGAGGFEIGLPAGLTAHLDVNTGSGQIRSELPIEARPAHADGAITLRARTGSGDVRLFRAA